MRWMDDERVVAQDAQVPGMCLLLDTDAFLERLARALPSTTMTVGISDNSPDEYSIRAGRAVYVRYKPRTNCLVSYRLQVAARADGGKLRELPVYAIAYNAQSKDKLAKSIHRGIHPALVWADLQVVVFWYPCDFKLPGLAKVAGDRLDAALAATLGLPPAALELLRYKPERRAVLRAHQGTDQWSVRSYTTRDYRQVLSTYRALADAPLPLPRLVGKSNRWQTLALDWLPGSALDTASGNHGAWFAAGELLQRLHGYSLLKPSHIRDRVSEIGASDSTLAMLAPSEIARVRRIHVQAMAILAAVPRPPVLIHGDCSADQFLVQPSFGSDEPVALVDLDHAGWGDPMRDLGCFVAQLDQAAVLGDMSFGDAAAAMEQFVKGYCVTDNMLGSHYFHPQRWAAHRALRLLELAVEPFRMCRPAWRIALETTIDVADRVMGDLSAAKPLRASSTLKPWGYALPAAELLTLTLDAATAATHALPPGDWRLARINPRGTDHALVQYTHEGGREIVGQWFADRSDYSRALRSLTKLDASAIVALPHRQMFWQLAGVDSQLPGLSSLCRAGGELIVHHPTRRGVVRRVDGAHHSMDAVADTLGGEYYCKIVRPSRAGMLAATMQAVHDAVGRVGITTPQVIAVDAASGVVTISALPGRNLLATLADANGCTDDDLATYGARAGEVLAVLHRSALHCTARHDAAAESSVLAQWLARLAWVAPALHDQVQPLAGSICAALTAASGPLAPLHRDCYDKQFLVGATGVGLLDFDTLALGEASLDVANLLVHCQLRVCQGLAGLARAQGLARAFVRGYGITAQMAERLQAYADACRLRLICVYGCRPTQNEVPARLVASLGEPLWGLD